MGPPALKTGGPRNILRVLLKVFFFKLDFHLCVLKTHIFEACQFKLANIEASSLLTSQSQVLKSTLAV